MRLKLIYQVVGCHYSPSSLDDLPSSLVGTKLYYCCLTETHMCVNITACHTHTHTLQV